MKKKILSVNDPKFETCKGRVVIARDDFPPNPMKDYDQVFLVWSNIPNEMSGSPNAENPREIDDETLVKFNVKALIHSGVWLKLGDGGFAEDPGGWDTTSGALVMYTTKERFEQTCAPWRTVPDGNGGRRDAKNDAEWEAYLRGIAEEELALIQKWIDCDCYWYKTEKAVRFVKKYEDGREVEGVEWEDGPDSCGGYYVEDVNEIDFPRIADWEAFDKTGRFVGQEYEVPDPA